MYAFQVIWTICRKDIRVWFRRPLMLLSSLLVPLSYFLVMGLGSQAVGRDPVALVNLDRGPEGQEIVQAMSQADVFRLRVVDADQAEQLYRDLQVAAVVTIPADFSQQIAANAPVAISFLVNNYNLDLTNDVRRAVNDAVMTYYQMQGKANPMDIALVLQPMRPEDITLFQYSILPLVVLIITVTGIIFSGMAATNEWEQQTIKGLLLAPFSPSLIIFGKVLAGFLCTFVLSASMLAIGEVLGFYRLEGVYWLSTLLVIALAAAMCSGVGVAIGAAFQKKQVVSYVATIASIWAFSLAGGVGVMAFEPQWLQQVAQVDPLLYAIHALQQAVFYQSFDRFVLDCVVLTTMALLAMGLGAFAMRRGLVSR